MSMTTTIKYQEKTYQADLNKPIDISIPLKEGIETVNCFYAPPLKTEPVIAGDFIGSTAKGGNLNFLNVHFNPHGNGTHTECAGHIARAADFESGNDLVFTINNCLKKFHFFAKLASLYPVKQANGDRIILPIQIKEIIKPGEAEALIIRCLPNGQEKMQMNYSGTNPPYLDHKGVDYLVDCGVQHLLIDLPSVDREEDGGKLLAHKAFWKYVQVEKGESKKNRNRVDDFERKNCTITEMIFVTNEILDGLYLLNLQIASFEIDASPSKPVLYKIHKL